MVFQLSSYTRQWGLFVFCETTKKPSYQNIVARFLIYVIFERSLIIQQWNTQNTENHNYDIYQES